MLGAEKVSAVSSDPKGENSQTITLLQPNFDSLPLKSTFKDKESDSEIKEDASISIVSENALVASATPVSDEEAIGGVFSSESASFYVVRPGDTAATVAEMYDVTDDTIWSANEMPKGSKLKVGEVLLILPRPGVEHLVAKGESLQAIAKKYQVNLDDILTANEIDPDTKLTIGEKLIIPGADMLSPEKPKSKPKSTTIAKGSGPKIKVANGYYINPVPGAKRTRGLTSYHHGVDLAAPAGTPILAAADGTVLIARNGHNGGFGNYVVIQHPNGTRTLYAHMLRLGTTAGAKVSQGQVIGYVGNTGRSRGNHAHVEFTGTPNPL